MEEYVPIITPMIIAKEKPLKISPPKMKIDVKAKIVVREVIIVRDRVSLIEVFDISPIFAFKGRVRNRQKQDPRTRRSARGRSS